MIINFLIDEPVIAAVVTEVGLDKLVRLTLKYCITTLPYAVVDVPLIGYIPSRGVLAVLVAKRFNRRAILILAELAGVLG